MKWLITPPSTIDHYDLLEKQYPVGRLTYAGLDMCNS